MNTEFNNKKVLITGVLGQDGSTMAEYLLKNTDVEIWGMYRRTTKPNFDNVSTLVPNKRLTFIEGDITDEVSINAIVQKILPDYYINFAANSFVGCSWSQPVQVMEINTLGVLKGLEAIRKYKPTCRFYSAGSSEEMGDVIYSPQDFNHPIRPRSPYGASKAASRGLVRVYRDSYDLYAVHGILYNHEGIRRGEEFVTRKITKGVARIKQSIERGKEFDPIELGNLDTKRDWSDSEDFVDGIWRMLNQEKYNAASFLGVRWNDHTEIVHRIKEYILASGEMHSVREFVQGAFDAAGIKGHWHNNSLNDKKEERFYLDNQEVDERAEYQGDFDIINDECSLVKINPRFYRPAEVQELCGDASPARRELGWKSKTEFKNLVRKMVENDIRLLK